MQTNIMKIHLFSLFLLKGEKSAIFFNKSRKGDIHSMKRQTGRSAPLKLSGENSVLCHGILRGKHNESVSE